MGKAKDGYQEVHDLNSRRKTMKSKGSWLYVLVRRINTIIVRMPAYCAREYIHL